MRGKASNDTAPAAGAIRAALPEAVTFNPVRGSLQQQEVHVFIQATSTRSFPMGFFTLGLLLLAASPGHAQDGKIEPGQWRSTDTILEMTNPLVPPEVVEKRKAHPAVVEYCVKTDDLLEVLVGKDRGGVCQGEVSVAQGKISGTRICGAGKATRSFEGTYTATRVETVREVTLDMPNGKAHTKSHVVSERVGACP